MSSQMAITAMRSENKSLVLYVDLTDEESAKLDEVDLTVSNLAFCLLGSRFHPVWMGDGMGTSRMVRLLIGHSDRFVWFEILSNDLLDHSPTTLRKQLCEQISRV